MPLRDALEAARDDAPDSKMQLMAANIAEGVRAGQSLAQALEYYPRYFSPTIIGLIAAGEKTGRLARIFEKCRDILRRQADNAQRMRKVTRYPKISFAIFIGLALLQHHTGLPYAAAALCFAAAIVWALRRYVGAFRELTDRFMLLIPVVGTLIRQNSIAFFADSLALVYSAGMDMRQGLVVAAGTIPNLAVRADIERVLPQVTAGQSVYNALKGSGQFDSLALGMLRAGENSGNYDACLTQLADYYNKKTDAAVTTAHQSASASFASGSSPGSGRGPRSCSSSARAWSSH